MSQMAAPFLVVGEIDEPEFIPPAFAEKLGRELADVVGGGDHEDGFRFFLEPVQHGAEYPRAGAAISGAARTTHTAEAFLDFVDPENAEADRLGGLDDTAEIGFGLADESAEQLSSIELEKRNTKDAGGGFRSEAFAGAGGLRGLSNLSELAGRIPGHAG